MPQLRSSESEGKAGHPPDAPAAKLKLAIGLHHQGQLGKAADLYQEILKSQPSHFDALQLLATIRAADHKSFAQAVELFDRALAINPDHAETLNNRGNVLQYLKRPEDALASYERALALKPDYVDALYNRSKVLFDLKRPEQALESVEQALALNPVHAGALNNQGLILQCLNRWEEALASYERALELEPDYAKALNNKGLVLRDLNRPEDALASYERALDLKPDYTEAHWNESLCRLLMGDFDLGWKKYEWRWKKEPLISELRDCPQSLWLGETPISGKTVLLHDEQGFGDTLQFCRYAPLVAALGARVVLEVPPALKALCRSLPGVDTLLAAGEAPPPIDFHAPLMSLPLAFGTRLDTIPADIPYLRADPHKIAAWQNTLGSRSKPRIGLAWSGRPTHTNDHNRSIPFSLLADLIDDTADFICLHKEFRGGEEDAARASGVRIVKAELKDFADTAALIETLDLVITVDTSVAHLAGALGKAVWILLPHFPDWRWLLDREDSPWYPSARLFRQRRFDQWAPVVAEVGQALADQFTGVGGERRQEPRQAPKPLVTASVEPLVTAAQANAAKLKLAIGLHHQGQLGQAADLYQEILKSQPSHFDALQLLAMILAADHKSFAQAVELFDRALAINPDHAETLNNRGNVLQYLKRPEDALASYERALALKPDYVDALYNRGKVLFDLKRPEQALESVEQALALNPVHVGALNNKGLILHCLNRWDDALASYGRALELEPDYARALNNKGLVLRDLNRPEDALASYERALDLRADDVEALINRGNALLDLKRPEDALESYERALAISPNHVDALVSRGVALRRMNRIAEAIVSFDRAVVLQPDSVPALISLGKALSDAGSHGECIGVFGRALALDPCLDLMLGLWLKSKLLVCDWEGYDQAVKEVVAGIDRGELVANPLTVLAIADSSALHRRAAEIYIERYHSGDQPLPAIPRRPTRRRLRIGYFSGDFRNHAVAYLAAGLFAAHDRERFEVIAFALGPPVVDAMRSRLEKSFDEFVELDALTDRDAALEARRRQIDIAVDLGGLTGHSRPGIFALRAAPVQIAYLGYPGTLGARFIDYLIADRTIVPEARQSDHAEKIIYLPSYQVNDSERRIADMPLSRAAAGLAGESFVYCCFNNPWKLNPGVFGSWMRILERTSGSVLWLASNSATVMQNLRKEAGRRGIDPDRLVFAARTESLEEHLARYRLADLFLDTWPYNAHTTGSDALWVGLPVLTCLGDAFPGRVAASLLNAVHLPELIASTPEAYEALAIELATNPSKLGEIKRKLASNRLTTPLFDTRLFTRHIEAAYTAVYERYQAGLAPEHIHVPHDPELGGPRDIPMPSDNPGASATGDHHDPA